MSFSHSALLMHVILFLIGTAVVAGTVCRTSGFWLLLSRPKNQLRHFLPDSYEFDAHPFSDINQDEHLVFLEFNIQHNCRSLGVLPGPWMHEFKLQIPYVRHEGFGPAIAKPMILVDSFINQQAAKLLYSLPMNYAEFSGSDSTEELDLIHYQLTSSDKVVNATFRPTTPWSSMSDFPSFRATYEEVNKQAWFCGTGEHPSCAYNSYKWEELGVRGVEVCGGLRGAGFGELAGVLESGAVVGAVEVDVELYVSPPGPCSADSEEL